MSNTKRYQSFFNDKRDLYDYIKNNSRETTESLINRCEALAKEKQYDYIASNKMLIEEEFNQLYNSLLAHGEKRREFWVYCYYCCILLNSYYDTYGPSQKAQEYADYAQAIKRQCKGEKSASPLKKSFFIKLGEKISEDLAEIASIPAKTSKMKEQIGFWNIRRIYWVFCRGVLTQGLQLMELLDMLDPGVDVQGFIDIIETPAEVLKGLSVGLFLLRFILNAGAAMKHLCFSKKEKSLAWYYRGALELEKRHPIFLNDGVWATVNSLTNYYQVFHISAATAGWLVAGFMVFDFCLILWQRQLAERDYKTKKEQYHAEIAYYESLRNDGHITEDEKKRHLRQLKAQISELDVCWNAKNAKFKFNATAAMMLAAGFSGSMFFASPMLIIFCYIVCMSAVAMYLSADAYGDYKEKRLRWELATREQAGFDGAGQGMDPRHVDYFLKEYEAARNEFIFTMLKNIIMPTLILTTFAICWQAALVLTALYVGYELYRAYSKKKNKAEPLSLPDIELNGEENESQANENTLLLSSNNDDYSNNENNNAGPDSSALSCG